MPEYAILIDDGFCVASAPSSIYADMATAIRSTVRTAALLATDDPGSAICTGPIDCEVQDRESRETQRFSVTVVTTFMEP